MDSRYQRGGLGKDQRVARRACVVGRERISNLAANGAPVSRVNHRDCNSRVLRPRLERNARFGCSQTIITSLGRFDLWPDFAGRLGDLEQQSRRCRHRACRAGRAAQRSSARMKTAAVETPSIATSRHSFVGDLAELVKARLTLLVLVTTAVGFYLGAEPPIDYKALFQTIVGTAAAAAGAAALNQWWERRADALMRRTKTRPIPAGRMAPLQALVVGATLSVFGVVYLAIVCNALSAVLAAITIAIYIFAYTPLKRTSTANTAVGAIPGAIPPMIGWAAARGDIGPGAWSLFVIVFLWQMPHFFAIAWMFREDYSRAGFRMISSDDSSGERSASQSVFFCLLLLVLAGLPAFVGIASYIYQPIELVLGGLFVAVAMRFLRLRTPSAARLLFFASIAYLPLLLAALVLTKL